MVADAEDVPPITASPIPNCHWLLQFLTAEIYPSSLIQTFLSTNVFHKELIMLEAIGARSSLEIEKHLKNPPSTSVIIQIDPKTAGEILTDRNKGNRPPKPNKVQQFAADMANNRWV